MEGEGRRDQSDERKGRAEWDREESLRREMWNEEREKEDRGLRRMRGNYLRRKR